MQKTAILSNCKLAKPGGPAVTVIYLAEKIPVKIVIDCAKTVLSRIDVLMGWLYSALQRDNNVTTFLARNELVTYLECRHGNVLYDEI